jgi:hypothetical protein
MSGCVQIGWKQIHGCRNEFREENSRLYGTCSDCKRNLNVIKEFNTTPIMGTWKRVRHSNILLKNPIPSPPTGWSETSWEALYMLA